MSLLATLLLLAHTAFAAPEAEQKAGSARIYGTVRANLAVPTGYTGLAQSYSAEVGALFRGGNQLGLRFAYVPYAPNVYGQDTPDHAVGPVLVWAYNFRVSPRMDLYPAVGLGAVFGPSPRTDKNMVLPYIQAGVGLRGRIPMSNSGAIAIGPEIGFVPTILAPYAAINVTMIGPKPAPVNRDEW